MPAQPNIIFVVMDDMGFGDTACYGPTAMRTPNMQRIAAEGATFHRMYSAPTCSPARIQILTGKYAQRVGMPRVLFPDDRSGIRAQDKTVAARLRELGYATMAIGKWHVGCQPEHFPTRHGFDHFFGLLYSNDMAPLHLYRDERVEEEVVNQAALTRRYAEEALRFIGANRQRPFFCYLAHTMPHLPLHAEPEFLGRSACGLYGDTIECIDHYLGRILAKLEELGIAGNTLLIVTSDNGPWYEGRTAGARGRKFDVYEGGIKVPFLARWPKGIPAGTVCREPAHLMDMLPTFVKLGGGATPTDVDGLEITGLLAGQGRSPHEHLFWYHGNDLKAVTRGKWKLHLKPQRGEYDNKREFPQLYDLEVDPDESYSFASREPALVAELTERIRQFDDRMRPFCVEPKRGE